MSFGDAGKCIPVFDHMDDGRLRSLEGLCCRLERSGSCRPCVAAIHRQALAWLEHRLHRQAVPRRKLLHAHTVPACDLPQVVSAAYAVDRFHRAFRRGGIKPGSHRFAEPRCVDSSHRDRHHQMAAGPDSIRGKPIVLLQHRDAGPVAVGDGSERVSTHDLVSSPAHALLDRELSEPRSEPFDSIGGELQPVWAARVCGPAIEPWIEPADLIERDPGQVRRDAEVDLIVQSDLLKMYVIGNRFEDDAVPARILDDGGDGEQAGYVRPRFPGELQRPYIHRLSSRAIPGHYAPDVAFAPVVSGDREKPVSVEILQELREVVERGAGRRDDVAASVVPRVLLQTVASPGRWHELPQSRRTRRRIRERPERALDNRQQRELDGHASLLDLAHDVRQIWPGPLCRTVEIFLVLPVPADFAHDPRVQRVRQ